MGTNKLLRGGNLLARALNEKGVEHVFTLAGGFCNPALEGFMQCNINVINCPHEQIAGHLADGHTRITRKPAVCLVGPEGFANAIPSMMEAWGERSPVIYVTGSSTLKRDGAGGFKEIDDVAIARPLTKYSAQINDGKRIGEFVDRAWKIATNGYPGPVHLSLPVDLMFSSFPADAGHDERPFKRQPLDPPRAWPDPDALEPILDVIAAAKRPILIGGHGIWWSGNEKKLNTACNALSLPMLNVPYHQKLLPLSSPSNFGLADIHQFPPSQFALNQSDVVIMLGCRLDNQMNFGNPPLFTKNTKLVCINGSHQELINNRAADHLLLSDPGAFLDELMALDRNGRWDPDRDWFERNQNERKSWAKSVFADMQKDTCEHSNEKMHPLQLSLDVIDTLDENDWLVFDGGNTHFWSEIAVNAAAWQGKQLAGVMHPGSFSMLGVGVSFGIAAKNTHPDSRVVVISGDGAFLSGGLSIEAAFQENCPIIVVIDNNGGLDCISQQQERLFDNGRHFATDFRDLPFHTLFKGLGGHGELVENRDQLQPALQRAFDSGKTACLNVKTRGVISPIVLATTNKRDKASIE